jgi:phage gp29-like protein
MARLIHRGEFASIRNSLIIPTYGGGRLTPQDTAYLEHGGGRYHALDALLDVFRDAHAGAVAQQRIGAVIGREWKLKEGGESAIDLKARDLCKAQLDALEIPSASDDDNAIYSLNTGLDAACTNLLWATFFGMSASEAIWDQQGKEVILQDLRSRDVRRFAWVAGESSGYKLRLLTRENPYDGIPVPARKFLIHRFFSLPLEDPYGVGIAARLFYPVFYKRHAIKFWLIFAEKWASPTAIAKHPTDANEKQVDDLLEMINAIASDTGVAIPDTVSLDFLKAPGGAIDSYEGLKKFCNEEISKIVIGQTATVDQSQGGGSRARDQVADGIRVELAKSDSDLLSGTINRLLAWMTWANFGPDAKAPRLWREFPELENKVNRSEEATVISTLTNAGFKPKKEWVENRLDVELEDVQDAIAPENPDTPPDIGKLLGGEPAPENPEEAIEPPPAFEEVEFGGVSKVLKWNGLAIGLEVMPGESRWKGTGHERTLTAAYGHIRLHQGNDGEALDCYVSPAVLDEGGSDRIFLVSQLDAAGAFDEEKLMLGYADEKAARSAYLAEMPKQFFGDIVELELEDLEEFKLDFAKTQKNCKKGYSCGFSCIRTAYKCKSPMKGQARNYADYLVGAVKRIGIEKMPQRHASDARAMGLGFEHSTTGQGILFPIAPLLKVSDKQKGEAKFTRSSIEKQILKQKELIKSETDRKDPDANQIARMQRRIKRMRDRVKELKAIEETGAIPRSSLRGTEIEVPAKPKAPKSDVQAQSDKVKASLDRQDVKAKKEADLDRQKQQEQKDAFDRSQGKATRAEVVAKLPDILKPSKLTKSYEDARDEWSKAVQDGSKTMKGKKIKASGDRVEYLDYGGGVGISSVQVGRTTEKALIETPTGQIIARIPKNMKATEAAFVASQVLSKNIKEGLASSDKGTKAAAEESVRWLRDFVDKRSKGQLLVPPKYSGEG